MADALDYAHRQGVVHRDVKPENVMLIGRHALVADFGIGLAARAAGNPRLTAANLVVGTPAYVSPEQASGDPGLDGRSDLYSLGCVLFEMLTGRLPFEGDTAASMIAKRFVSRSSRPARPASRPAGRCRRGRDEAARDVGRGALRDRRGGRGGARGRARRRRRRRPAPIRRSSWSPSRT